MGHDGAATRNFVAFCAAQPKDETAMRLLRRVFHRELNLSAKLGSLFDLRSRSPSRGPSDPAAPPRQSPPFPGRPRLGNLLGDLSRAERNRRARASGASRRLASESSPGRRHTSALRRFVRRYLPPIYGFAISLAIHVVIIWLVHLVLPETPPRNVREEPVYLTIRLVPPSPIPEKPPKKERRCHRTSRRG